MKKIIKKLLQAVKPGPSRRNSLTRGQPRKLTRFEQSVAELQALFVTPQNRGRVMTWAESVAQLQAVVA